MIVLADEAATDALGRRLAAVLRPGDVVTVSGDLGAGKTALARGVLRGLGFEGDVPSPSFPIVLPYDPPELRLSVAHVDLYRIDEPGEVAALALDDLGANGVLLIEWPERLAGSTWPGALALRIDVIADGRCLTAQVPPAWEARWPPR
jgi:tRNA threonylcarbamoyladenosine biosynthesis protein TsaE